jgi:hypothetical protein
VDKGRRLPLSGIAGNGNQAKKTVLTAGMRKLAHIIYGVLTTRQPYSPERLLFDIKKSS